MNVYTNNCFRGHYPVGTAAVVVAETPEAAADQLQEALALCGLNQIVEASDMIPLETTEPGVKILTDGNY